MRGKIYTLSELNRALPLIREIVIDLVHDHLRLCDELRQAGITGADPELTERDFLRELTWETRELVDEIRGFLSELGELGVFLRDPRAGLVSAYGEHEGEIVYFTWQLGEDRIRFWHSLFGSHRERKPVLPSADTAPSVSPTR